MPTVAIGLPVYNAEDTVARTVRSILDQSFRDFRLIVSDNKSTDRTIDIIRETVAGDPRVEIHLQERNLGAPGNFWFVLENATETFFAFCGADDIWETTFLERCVHCLSLSDEIGSAFSFFRVFYHRNQALGPLLIPTAFTGDTPFKRFLFSLLSCFSNSFYGVHRRETLTQIMATTSCGDYEDIAILQKLAAAHGVVVVPQDLFRSGIRGEARAITLANGRAMAGLALLAHNVGICEPELSRRELSCLACSTHAASHALLARQPSACSVTERVSSVTNRVAVVLASSDNSADIALQIERTFQRYWPISSLRRFVLLTTESSLWDRKGWTPLIAGEDAGWREHLLAGLGKLPAEFDYVLLVLDDFALTGAVDEPRLLAGLAAAIDGDLPYFRLKPTERSFAGRCIRAHIWQPDLVPLDESEPYYSSLQVALWNRVHLERTLGLAGSIWDFEHHHIAGVTHYAARYPLIRYRHLVERGRWLPEAAQVLKKQGISFQPGHRAQWGRLYALRSFLAKRKFDLIGYGVFRLKSRFLTHAR